MTDLRLVVLDNIKELGTNVDKYISKVSGKPRTHMVGVNVSRFNNGEGKVTFVEDCRDKDVFILSDVGNYGAEYSMHGLTTHMSPDEHFQDIKRVISALSGSAGRVTVIMPYLYQSRQDKRKMARESLDCAMALQELERLHVNRIVTFDAHEPKVSNAIPNIPFENFFPTDFILEKILKVEHPKNLLVISPDIGAMERARYYSEVLRCDVGLFYKRRDLSKVVDGKNPIVEHAYMGTDVAGKTCLVVDDMIASGGTMIEVGQKLRERGAANVYFVATFSLFTEGVEAFAKAHEEGVFDKLYTTNLTYIPEKILKENKWICAVDASKRIGEIIVALHKGKSLEHFAELDFYK